MDVEADCPLAAAIAERIRTSRTELTTRWLERIAARVSLDPNRIFPTDQLLDHVPLLLVGIADYIEDPSLIVSADGAVISKARELGALRHAQGFDEYEIMKEYEIFGSILFAFVQEIIDDIDEDCSRRELLACTRRLFHAITLIQQATATQYLQLMHEQLAEREQRLETFNRSLAHEFRNRVGAAKAAGQMLLLPDLDGRKRDELAGVIVRSTNQLVVVLENLLQLSRVGAPDQAVGRHVHLADAAAEVVRQLRTMAEASGVTVRIADSLPECEVDAAVAELALTNLVANAIKYSDPGKPDRWVQIAWHEAQAAGSRSDGAATNETVVEVRDNGLGVPEAARDRLFQPFYRAHDEGQTGIGGTGLGLSIVRETAESLGGRVFAEFPPEGSVFGFTLPCPVDDAGGEASHTMSAD
ncbi:MAG: sensor histidine kinase [Gemmatimonadota bacterium]|nr:sensor histidine kinase [Gemmatimonadota bacterium]